MRKPAKHRTVCGTPDGYRRHSRNTEERCTPCVEAWNARPKKIQPEGRPTAAEVAAEIEWLASLNQGTDYILRAVGYANRPATLAERLRNNGHIETARWVLGTVAA